MKQRIPFEKHVVMLAEYFQKHQRLPLYREKTEGNLGWFTVYLRNKLRYNNFSQDRLFLLEQYGLLEVLKKRPHHRKVTPQYIAKVKSLKRFISKYHRLPQKKETFEGWPLGVWCVTQRYLYRKNELLAEHVTLLEPTGLLKTGIYGLYQKVDYIWTFYQKYQRMPYRDEIVQGKPIGQWWYHLRDQVIHYLLCEQDLEYLQKQYPDLIQMIWEWDLRFFVDWVELLKEYQLKTKKIKPATREKYKRFALGSWCAKQRYLARNNKLSERKIELLEPTKLLADI